MGHGDGIRQTFAKAMYNYVCITSAIILVTMQMDAYMNDKHGGATCTCTIHVSMQVLIHVHVHVCAYIHVYVHVYIYAHVLMNTCTAPMHA